MSNNFKEEAKFVKHPTAEGVFMKHFFGKNDNDRLNNLEVYVVPGFEVPVHTHEESTEFFYVVKGKGEYLDNGEWKPITKGDAFRAPQGVPHAVKNTGIGALLLLSTFSPAIW